MGSTNKTSMGLSKFVEHDGFKMDDWNNDMENIQGGFDSFTGTTVKEITADADVVAGEYYINKIDGDSGKGHLFKIVTDGKFIATDKKIINLDTLQEQIENFEESTVSGSFQFPANISIFSVYQIQIKKPDWATSYTVVVTSRIGSSDMDADINYPKTITDVGYTYDGSTLKLVNRIAIGTNAWAADYIIIFKK